ncbi:MAG TPA: hypothetical protein DDY37_03825 [Legionella sp.]|nr:hypothetical protein [Legionella sp.]
MHAVRAHFSDGSIDKKFKFLSDNRGSMEHEFNQLHAILDGCGLIKVSDDPKSMTPDALRILLNNKPAYVLYNSTILYVDNQLNRERLEVTRVATTDLARLKVLFPARLNELKDATKDSLAQISSLTGHVRSIHTEDNQDKHWLFCYYTSFMLKTYYETYNPSKASKYREACADIERRFQMHPVALPAKNEATLFEMVTDDYNEVVSTPFNAAKLRKLVGEMNVQRLSTRFSLLTLKQSLLLADQWHWLDNLQSMLGLQVNIAILDAPLGIYNALSVVLMGTRLVLDLGMLFQHVFFPVGDENQLTPLERASVEIQQHFYHLANDTIWTIVNTLCNYGSYFHVAAPLATALMVGFTVFDIFWLSYLLIQVDADYASKRNEYVLFKSKQDEGSPAWLMVEEQLKQLERSAEKDQMELKFYIVAACILECGFVSAFVLASPALMPACLLMCNFAIAMYLSGGKYGVYREKSLVSIQEKNSEKSTQDMNEAWNDLMGTMAKNTVMPFILFGALTLSVPAAVILTLAYIAHERGLTAAYGPKILDYVTGNVPALSMA